MSLTYDGWCRRIDLSFRSRYPYLKTRIFKINDYNYQILIIDDIDDFSEIAQIFKNEIKYVTLPTKLVNQKPNIYKYELECIDDKNIPSKFEGFPLTNYQIFNYISSIYSDVKFSEIKEDHQNHIIAVELVGRIANNKLNDIQETLDGLKLPYSFQIIECGQETATLAPHNEVFSIVSSQSKKSLNCPFLERDEQLWFDNIEGIYSGSFSKEDLYFIDSKKTSCLVNFSMFKNANLRNYLLLYDVVYCVLPFAHDMKTFLINQKVTREEILHLVERGRLKILNVQPESRLDYGFINEAYKTNPSSVASRRALSALCAIDLVAINESYIFSNPELNNIMLPLIKDLASIMQRDINSVAKLLLWPKQALRESLGTLNEAGPMGIASYGVNKSIVENLPSKNRDKLEFEFTVNSAQIHLAHALDATYFPFFTEGEKYTDHPYALMMGNMLNFFKTTSFESLVQTFDLEKYPVTKNPSINLISIFEINDYIPVQEFEEGISKSVIRSGMNSLFSELALLETEERNQRITTYNLKVEKALTNKDVFKQALDLGEDILGEFVPCLGLGKKIAKVVTKKTIDKFPAIQNFLEILEEKTKPSNQINRNISILSQINRVARLKRN